MPLIFRNFVWSNQHNRSNAKECIIASFQKTDNHLQVDISTIAFGMGVDCPNVWQVIHHSPPDHISRKEDEKDMMIMLHSLSNYVNILKGNK